MNRKEIIPEMWYDQIPGISVINGSKIPYGTWHLLNQAISCYRNSEHFGCISCLVGSVEIWLRRTLNVSSRIKLVNLIKNAEESEVISNEEAEHLHELRGLRNRYIHFDLKKLPKVKSATEKKIGEKEAHEIEPYPTQDHKDAIPLMLLVPSSYLNLNYVIEFFSKRYPNDSGFILSYYKCKLTKIEEPPDKRLILDVNGAERIRD